MKKLTVDVAVIAAGPAGLAAAISASEGGASVAVFEKASIAGGAANMGMGPFAVESVIQKKAMVDLTREKAFQAFMDYTHWQVDAHLVRDYFWKSADTIDWLMDMGVEFAGAVKYYPASEPTWHVVRPEGGGRPGPRAASAMIRRMVEHAAGLGIQVYYETPATRVCVQDGRVTGLEASSRSGEEYQVEAKAVVIATGGFGDNPAMISEFCGCTWGKDMFNFRIPGLAGDGLRMAWEAGAGHGHMEMERILGTGPLPEGDFTVQLLFNQPNLVVNLSGERVMDESIIQNGAVSANVVTRQQNCCAYSIIDDSIVRYYRKHGLAFPSEVLADAEPAKRFAEEMDQLLAQCPDAVFAANSPEELAQKIGMDAAAFAETLAAYNEACALHYDDLFCKSRRYLLPLTGKRYYAMRLVPSAYGTLGGIKVNHRLEVLTDAHRRIDGLYAAGSDVCDLYAGTYLYYLPGNTMGFAVNSGRIAGENAADYVLGG